MTYDFETRERIKAAVKAKMKEYGCFQETARDILDNEARAAGRLPIEWKSVYPEKNPEAFS